MRTANEKARATPPKASPIPRPENADELIAEWVNLYSKETTGLGRTNVNHRMYTLLIALFTGCISMQKRLKERRRMPLS
jgi:hypothetical protein